MTENEMLSHEEEMGEDHDEGDEVAKRAKLASMKIDRTPHYDEDKKANLEAQLKQYKETGSVPFTGVEDET